MKEKVDTGLGSAGAVQAKSDLKQGITFKNTWKFECFDKDGKLKWAEEVDNLVVNTGLDEVLEQFFNGSAYTATHYVGLTDGTPTVAAADTMASHAGWAEVTSYSEANRVTYNPAAAASQSIDNSASKASFSINGTATVGGAFLSTDNTKGGTAGILIGVAAFDAPGDRSVVNGDTLQVTITVTATSS